MPGGEGRLASNISSALATDLHGVVTNSRERSDQTLGSVGKSTVLRSRAHCLQSGLGTGLGHLAFHQRGTFLHRHFVVLVALLRVE